MESRVKKTLKSLCCSHGWSYGVLWRFDQPCSMLLTLEEAYCEEQMAVIIDSMLLQVHMLSEGMIGQTAFNGDHQWIFSDTHLVESSSLNNNQNQDQDQDQDLYQKNSDILSQFSTGIKTIAVFSVEPRGVVQFGSTQKIVENLDFIAQTRMLFKEMEYVEELVEPRDESLTFNIDSYDTSGLLDSLISSGLSKFNAPISNCTWSKEDSSCLTSLEQQQISPENSTNNRIHNFQFDLLHDTSQLLESSKPFIASNGELLERSSGLLTFQEDEISQWLAPSLDDNDLSRAIQVNSIQSSKNNTSTPMVVNDLFDFIDGEIGLGKTGEIWEDFSVPVVNGNLPVSELDNPRTELFSEIEIQQLLDNNFCNYKDQMSTNKKRKMETYPENQFSGLSCLTGNTDFLRPLNNHVNTTSHEHKKQVFPKSQVGLWIDDSYSVISQSKKNEDEQAKKTKKRAKPGESTRARPKDRQQIQDRLSELRKIIPNAIKLSIDALLDRTIKLMIFLQSAAKYADKIKNVDEPKLIDQENGVILKDNVSGGATWAFEVGGRTMVCPIIVEDLGPPGQMLIEMLCEERGLFLEIAEIVRGFGLNILKGVMEARENKIWARFIVEANKQHVTRIDIFWSLIHLLQQPPVVANSTNLPNNAFDEKSSTLFNNYHQLPIR